MSIVGIIVIVVVIGAAAYLLGHKHGTSAGLLADVSAKLKELRSKLP